MAKYGMSMCVLGMAEELRGARHRGERALAAHGDRHRRAEPARRRRDARGTAARRRSSPTRRIAILRARRRELTGNFFIDEDVLREEGVTDFERYAVEPGQELWPDLFL